MLACFVLEVPVLFCLYPMRDGICHVKHGVDGFVLTHKLRCLFVLERADILGCVGTDKTVLMHHYRQTHTQILSDAKCHECQVIGFLGVVATQVDPSRIASQVHIGVVAVDVERCSQSAVDDREHDRQAHTARLVEDFYHKCESLRAGGSRSAHTRSTRRHTTTHRGVFGFDHDKLAVHIAIGQKFGVVLHDRSRRSDRIGRYDIDIGLTQRMGGGHIPIPNLYFVEFILFRHLLSFYFFSFVGHCPKAS